MNNPSAPKKRGFFDFLLRPSAQDKKTAFNMFFGFITLALIFNVWNYIDWNFRHVTPPLVLMQISSVLLWTAAMSFVTLMIVNVTYTTKPKSSVGSFKQTPRF
jgi:hypothetical protein